MNQSIVCGIDSSSTSLAAARVAAGLARDLGHALVLAHVADDPPTFPYRDTRRRELQRRAAIEQGTAMLVRVAATLPGVAPLTRVLLGDPVEELTTLSREEDAALLIVGSRGRGPLAAAVLGSVSARLASAAECPVVVVPSSDAADRFLARRPRGRLLCGFDDSVGATQALQLAVGLAERLELELLPVHVDGDPAEALRERALADEASAIVAGSRGRGAWHAATLAATAPVPVVVVPPAAGPTRLAESTADNAVTEILGRARHRTQRGTPEVPVTAGRFSVGIEQRPDAPSKLRRGRYSDGLETLPTNPGMLRRGRFSEGIEQLPEAATTIRRGSFADGYDDIP